VLGVFVIDVVVKRDTLHLLSDHSFFEIKDPWPGTFMCGAEVQSNSSKFFGSHPRLLSIICICYSNKPEKTLPILSIICIQSSGPYSPPSLCSSSFHNTAMEKADRYLDYHLHLPIHTCCDANIAKPNR